MRGAVFLPAGVGVLLLYVPRGVRFEGLARVSGDEDIGVIIDDFGFSPVAAMDSAGCLGQQRH